MSVIYIAGVNRGDPDHGEENAWLAKDIAHAVRWTETITNVVYANSIQAGNTTPHGAGKAAQEEPLGAAAHGANAQFGDTLLPNPFEARCGGSTTPS